ncbi:MAG: ornithine cyclodeaminase family protein [Bacteroidetes bacterium]|jgi:ornithine cyclodeaminase|nr:ornithine cyclodeaminase family protein [Bacteroidota bacterium]MDF1863552.1 ornithine cyclodeaminase family protein [Saprospiraceae bacterium]
MIPFFDAQMLEERLSFKTLIECLRQAFQEEYTVPTRLHHNVENPAEGIDSTLLLMPAWKAGEHLGVKIALVSPNNGKYNLPAIQGIYTLFNAQTGVPIAQMDAKTLTTLRTAAASALAADFLSRKDSETLLMVGTGALAPKLIQAHCTIRPIKKVMIWGRNFEKAKQLSQELSFLNMDIQGVENLEINIPKADIISCATLSKDPLIFGKYLKEGQHIDLVGSYKPDMREADDEVIQKSEIFVDILAGATKETGDIVIPIQKGILQKEEIKGDLFSLCRQERSGRSNKKEITLFKSVGHALEDLAAAILAIN